MTREYLRVTPTSSRLDPDSITTSLTSLHKLARPDSGSLLSRVNPLHSRARRTYEFVAISEGEHEPVEFYYGADGGLDVLEQRLRSIYPASFDVEHVDVDLTRKLVRPVEYPPEDFRARVADGLLFMGQNERPFEDEVSPSSREPFLGGPEHGPEEEDSSYAPVRDGGSLEGDIPTGAVSVAGSQSFIEIGEAGVESVTAGPGPAGGNGTEMASPDSNDHAGWSATPSAPDDHLSSLDGSTLTADGTYLARPPLHEVTPVGVQWRGAVDRRKDWMTTLSAFRDALDDGPRSKEDDRPGGGSAPLAPLIDQLTEARQPLAFQVVFQPKPDWSKHARRRAGALLGRTDTLLQQFLSMESPGRRQRAGVLSRRLGPENPTRVTSSNGAEPPLRDREKEETEETRLDLLRQNEPGRTFTVNARVLGLTTEREDQEALEARLDALCSVFDPLDGPYYEITGERLMGRGLTERASTKRARSEFERFRSRSLTVRHRDRIPWPTNRADSRPDLVLNADELANLVIVPSTADLTVEGSRGVRAEQRSRNPLPRPHPGITQKLRAPGLALGFLLDENGTPEQEPIRLPTGQLPHHVGRFAKSGAGKTVALINDALSLYDQTTGPIFMIDTKGGGLPEKYMRAHATRFGFDDLEGNVLHFEVPDILPGFAFFNIEPALANGIPRLQAVKDRVDHYEEVLKMTMGEERYEQAVVSPNLLKYLIRLMYDEEHGLDHGAYRESVDYFGQSQLEQVVDQLYHAGPPQAAPEEAPQSSTEEVTSKIHRHLNADPRTFANIMGGVSNRMDYITADPFLRQIFDTTEPRFDIREVLDEDLVVIFDLGNLRMDAAKVMAGVILTNLYDAVTERGPAELAATPDEYVVNLLIDEAASVVVSQILNDLLEKGREFKLSVELASQFPEQMQFQGDRQVYLNVLNNIGAPIVGKIAVDDEIARALAHEDMDSVEFRNRVRALPRGEWIAQVPSPVFGETGPMPFSVSPLPIPAGHPESENPLTPAEEDRFQQALDRVHERTQAAYGVPVDSSVPTVRVPESIQETLALATDGVDELLAVMTRYVQLREGVRETKGWVSVEAVDDLLEAWYETPRPGSAEGQSEARGQPGIPTRTDLAEIRDRSPLFELSIDVERGETVMRLTETGEDTSRRDTGLVQAAGGAGHDEALARVEAGLTRAGYLVTPVRQDGSAQPDAWAVHPEVDVPLAVEVETTTYTKPARVLTNLGRAQANGAVPVFVVPAGDEDEQSIARRVENILSDPVRDRIRNGVAFYTGSDHVTFTGGAAVDGGVTAVRPVATGVESPSNRTHWRREGDEFVLRDEAGTVHARVSHVDEAPKEQFPATYSVDNESGTITVFVPGELPRSYDSDALFRSDWVPIKRPLVPEVDLPVQEYGPGTYAIVLLPDGARGDAGTEELAVVEDGHLHSIERLTTALRSGELHPSRSTQTGESSGQGDGPVVADGDQTSSGRVEDGVEMESEHSIDADHQPRGKAADGVADFAAERLTETEQAVVPFRAVFDAYEAFVEERGFDPKPFNRFTPALKDEIEVESKRKWLDGKSQQCYTGIELTDAEVGEEGGGDRTESDSGESTGGAVNDA